MRRDPLDQNTLNQRIYRAKLSDGVSITERLIGRTVALNDDGVTVRLTSQDESPFGAIIGVSGDEVRIAG